MAASDAVKITSLQHKLERYESPKADTDNLRLLDYIYRLGEMERKYEAERWDHV